jgi:HTH-type transcriptional regulator/antitoxin HigA
LDIDAPPCALYQFDMPSDSEHRTPGQLLKQLLDDRGWSQTVLAVVAGIDANLISRVITGKRPVTADLALTLGELFCIDPVRFLELQQSYDLAQARVVARPDPSRTKRAHLFGSLPIVEMIKRGWIAAQDMRDVETVEKELARFFGVSSAEEIEILPHAAKKTLVADATPTPVQVAWLYRVREIAKEMLVARYSPQSVRAAVPKLSALLSAPEEARKVPRILAEAGIRFVIVESLPSAKIDGVCMWLDDRSPVIGLSLRYDRIDNFWFVLRHEIEHVLRIDGRGDKIAFDFDLEGDRSGVGESLPEAERAANLAAQEFCVPAASMDQFVARKAPFFSERDILGFARSMRVHPGLVAGQLQRRTGRYDRFRDHQVKIRALVCPGSTVDGWGDIAPVGL